jgi:hypothetical protein
MNSLKPLKNYKFYSYELFSTREVSLKIELGAKEEPNRTVSESQIESKTHEFLEMF